MSDLRHTNCDLECRETGNGRYEAVIAVNNDVGDGASVELERLEFDAYMKNPVVHFAHDFRVGELPIGRTTNLRWDDNNHLIAEFEFLPDDSKAERVQNAWRRGFLRAASITWQEKMGKPPRLREWSIVAMPADVDAVRGLVDLEAETGDSEMDETKIREVVASALNERNDSNDLVERVSAAVIDTVRKTVDDAIELRDAALKNADEAERDAATEAELNARHRAQERADLLVRCSSLLPQDFLSKEASDREIMLAAIGDEIPAIAEESDDYIRASLDAILHRRAEASMATPQMVSVDTTHFTRAPTLTDIRRIANEERN